MMRKLSFENVQIKTKKKKKKTLFKAVVIKSLKLTNKQGIELGDLYVTL